MAEEMQFDKKYLILTVIAGLLYYAAYFLKAQNYYSIVVIFVFLFALLKNFKSKEGINVLICLLIFNITTLFLVVYTTVATIFYQSAYLLINIVLIVFIIIGLKKLKTWALLLSILILSYSSVNLVLFFISLVKQKMIFNLYTTIIIARNLLSLAVYTLFLAYLIKSREYFGKK